MWTPTVTPPATPTLTLHPTATATPTVAEFDVTFLIGSAIGMPGEPTTIDVVLQTAVEVVETQNELVIVLPIQVAVDGLGQPRCAVNPEIDKDATSFTLLCDESGVCTLRAVVQASDNADPIPNGSTLYTCEVDIAPNAAPGTYVVGCAAPEASDPDGNALSSECIGGSIEVGEVPTATPTPLNTPPRPSATVTPQMTPTRTHSRRSRQWGDDSCQVVAPAGTHGVWLLGLPASLLWLRRRRLSRQLTPPKGGAGHRSDSRG